MGSTDHSIRLGRRADRRDRNGHVFDPRVAFGRQDVDPAGKRGGRKGWMHRLSLDDVVEVVPLEDPSGER